MTTPPVEPVIRVHYQAPVAEGKALLFETYVPLTMTKYDIDIVVDKLRCIAERQEAIVKVAILQKQIAAEEAHLEALKTDLVAARDRSVERWANSGRKGDFKPTESERQHVANTESSIGAREHQIKVLKGEYAHYIALVEAK
jgi:uncharacterized protein (DUF342 family)